MSNEKTPKPPMSVDEAIKFLEDHAYAARNQDKEALAKTIRTTDPFGTLLAQGDVGITKIAMDDNTFNDYNNMGRHLFSDFGDDSGRVTLLGPNIKDSIYKISALKRLELVDGLPDITNAPEKRPAHVFTADAPGATEYNHAKYYIASRGALSFRTQKHCFEESADVIFYRPKHWDLGLQDLYTLHEERFNYICEGPIVVVRKTSKLVHDVHATAILEPGVYKITYQRARVYTPEGWTEQRGEDTKQ